MEYKIEIENNETGEKWSIHSDPETGPCITIYIDGENGFIMNKKSAQKIGLALIAAATNLDD